MVCLQFLLLYPQNSASFHLCFPSSDQWNIFQCRRKKLGNFPFPFPRSAKACDTVITLIKANVNSFWSNYRLLLVIFLLRANQNCQNLPSPYMNASRDEEDWYHVYREWSGYQKVTKWRMQRSFLG